MSDQPSDDEAPAGAVESTAKEAEEAPAAAPESPAKEAVEAPAAEEQVIAQRTPRRRSALLPLAALLVALFALALAGQGWWQQRASSARLSQVSDDAGGALSGVRQSMEALRATIQRLESTQSEFENRLRNDRDARNDLSRRLSQTEQRLAGMQGASSSVQREWGLAEAEYYLQIANSHLQLARDPDSALVALQAADDRLQTLADPAFTGVRSQLAQEIEALRATPRLDIQGVALRLGSLAARIEQLPLRTPSLEAPAETDGAETAAESGFDRAMATMGEALSGMVSVRRSDEQAIPVLAPEEQFFLRRNLELQLQVARLAALQRDATNYRESLRSVRGWITDYFDNEDEAVGAAVASLTELEALDVDPAMPDISGSLTLLRGVAVAEAQAL